LFQGSTIQRLGQLLDAPTPGTAPGHNLVRLDAGTATSRPLFLVHGGGGEVLGYAELVRELGDRPIYGLHAPGLDGGPLPPASIQAIASAYVERVRATQPQGPYQLGGWSLGGVV